MLYIFSYMWATHLHGPQESPKTITAGVPELIRKAVPTIIQAQWTVLNSSVMGASSVRRRGSRCWEPAVVLPAVEDAMILARCLLRNTRFILDHRLGLDATLKDQNRIHEYLDMCDIGPRQYPGYSRDFAHVVILCNMHHCDHYFGHHCDLYCQYVVSLLIGSALVIS